MRRVIEHRSCYRGVMAGRLMEKYCRAFSPLAFAAERMPACLFLEQRRTRYSCLRRVEVKMRNLLNLMVQWSSIASMRSAHA
jgi:hypothetical protein